MDEVIVKESASQWGEYFLHKLASIAEGGLGETTIDVSSVDLGNDQLTHFWGGLREGALDAYRTNITSIKFTVDNTGGNVTLDGGEKTFNDTLKIIAIVNNKPSSTFTLGTVASGFKNSSNADLPDSVIEQRITSIAAVDLSSPTSWGYYLNHLNATNGNIESIDLFDRNLADNDSRITQFNVNAFFAALQARADRTTVKDIYLNISDVGTLSITLGTGTTMLTALKSVVISKGLNSGFLINGAVQDNHLAVISSTTNNGSPDTLGDSGTVAQWKAYLAYLLEDAAHGGTYTGSAPVALNLTSSDLKVSDLNDLQVLETAIAELPARLKARISAILIKTTNGVSDYTAGGYEFGDAFTAPILAELSALKAVVIDASLSGSKPVFDTDGDFFAASSISKIVY